MKKTSGTLQVVDRNRHTMIGHNSGVVFRDATNQKGPNPVKTVRLGSASIILSLWPGLVFAQNVSISGRVSDLQGGTVNGALVTLTSAAAPTPKTTRTGADGTFSIDSVLPGPVSLQVDVPGFERWTQTVTVGATTAPISVVL